MLAALNYEKLHTENVLAYGLPMFNFDVDNKNNTNHKGKRFRCKLNI